MVEDSSDLRALWHTFLTQSGFIVEEAVNGADALMKAHAVRPDLVLMDLSMPIMDGLEAITRLRADVVTADVLIIALTASDAEETARLAEAAGADVYIDKPVMPDALLGQMEDALMRPRALWRPMARVRR